MLKLHRLTCGYRPDRPVLDKIDLALSGGEFVCLLGPNGSGKTALLRTLAGTLPPRNGELTASGRDLTKLTAAGRARLLACVPQAHAPVFAFRVRDVVVMGRAARWGLWGSPSTADWQAADDALAQIGLSDFAERLYTEISGGERQLTLIARALAQQARFLALDEPAASLDFGNQVRVLRTLRRLADDGIGILMATHHPEHALRCATRVAILRDGRLMAEGPPAELLTASRLQQIYGVPFVVADLPDPTSAPIRTCTALI